MPVDLAVCLKSSPNPKIAMPFFDKLICDEVAERIERGMSASCSVSFENLCRFVGKVTSVCGKNHISLWEKFGEQS